MYTIAEKAVVISSLVLYSGVLIAMNLLEISELYKFWTSWVLAGAFTYAWWLRRNPGDSIRRLEAQAS